MGALWSVANTPRQVQTRGPELGEHLPEAAWVAELEPTEVGAVESLECVLSPELQTGCRISGGRILRTMRVWVGDGFWDRQGRAEQGP